MALFFIHTEDRRMSGRFKVKADDLSGFGFKERIITLHVAAHPVGLQPRARPDPRHRHMIEAELLGQFARAPVGRTIARAAASIFQNTSLQGGAVFVRGATAVAGVKPRDALGQEARFPAADVALAAAQCASNGGVGLPFGQPKNKLCSARVLGSRRARTNSLVEFQTFRRSQAHRSR